MHVTEVQSDISHQVVEALEEANSIAVLAKT